MPLPIAPNPWSFYRLGPTKEKGLFKQYRRTYDGVVIPAHIASYYHKFCSEFIGSLAKPYFIDPITYIFANDPAYLKRFVKDKDTGRTKRDAFGRKRKGDVKRSYSKLVEHDYQSLAKLAVDADRALVPSDFADARASDEFVRNVVEFQTTRLAAVPDKYRKYAKYAEAAGHPFSMSGNPPMCIVAPYFSTTMGTRGWHSTNLQLARQTKAMGGDLPVFAMILADLQVLDDSVEQIAADYTRVGVDGILLWPDGFSSEQDIGALKVVTKAVQALSGSGKPVIQMFGDAFALTLHYAGLSGFACGICYGERRLSTEDVDVEGGIPPRYYIPQLKKKVVIETEARRIRLQDHPDLVCRCDVCQRKPDPALQDDTESREHFMLARAAEINAIRQGLSKQEFAAALDEAFQQHRHDPLLQPIGHLANWTALLKSL